MRERFIYEIPLLQALKSVGVTLQDVSSSSSVLLTPTPNGKIHLVRILISKGRSCENVIKYTKSY